MKHRGAAAGAHMPPCNLRTRRLMAHLRLRRRSAPGAVDAAGGAVDLADALGQEGERWEGARGSQAWKAWRLTPSTLLISEIG